MSFSFPSSPSWNELLLNKMQNCISYISPLRLSALLYSDLSIVFFFPIRLYKLSDWKKWKETNFSVYLTQNFNYWISLYPTYLNICGEREFCCRQKAPSGLLFIQMLASVISYHYCTSILQRKIKARGRYTLPHLLFCIFKAFRHKVDILKSCDETLLFAGNLGVKGLYFGMSRKCMLEDKESINQRILSTFIDHILRTTARIGTPLNVLLTQWLQTTIINLFPTVLCNP